MNENRMSVSSLRELVKEARRDALDRRYKEKFIENFVDVRSKILSEKQLNSIADHLYEIIFKDKS